MYALRRPDGDARSRAGHDVDTGSILGLSEVRQAFLDDLSAAQSREGEARNGARVVTAESCPFVRASRGDVFIDEDFLFDHFDLEDEDEEEDDEFDEFDDDEDKEDDDEEDDEDPDTETWQVALDTHSPPLRFT